MKELSLKKMDQVKGGIDWFAIGCAAHYIVAINGLEPVSAEKAIIDNLFANSICADYV